MLGGTGALAGEVAVELISVEGGDGRHEASHRDQTAVERLVGGELVRGHLTSPEAAAREAHVPVAQLLGDEVTDSTSGTRRLVVLQITIDLEDEAIECREDPAVDLGALSVRELLTSRRIEAIEVSIQREELIRIVQRREELTAYLIDTLDVELQVVPRRRVADHVPAQGVRAILLDRLEGIDSIAQTLTHLVAILIEHEPVGDDSLVAIRPTYHRSDSVEREEPPTRLVHPFGDEVRGEGATAVEQFLIFKGIVELCEGHSTRVKPHVDEVRLTAHGLARGRD